MSELSKIGFIGLGNMGLPMASNLVRAGHTVFGVDMNPEAEAKLSEIGGLTGVEVSEFVKEVDFVMTSLPTPQVVESVYLGEKGILAEAGSPLTLIDFSTIAPEVNEKVYNAAKEKGVSYLGAPVSGSVTGAVDATLTIMVGGEKSVFERALPVLEVIGKNIFHLGEEVQTGTVIKLLNNLMIGFYSQAVAEAVVLGERLGVDQKTIYDVLSVSFGQSRVYDRNFKEFISQDTFEPGFSMNLLLKDLNLAKQMADQSDSLLPIGDKLIELYKGMVEKGYGESDFSAGYVVMKELHEEKNMVSQ